MHIIFGDAATVISKNYTVLELDTFKIPSKNKVVQSFCVVPELPLNEYATLENNKKIHSDLITQYRAQNWEYCELAFQVLRGKFGGELDSFYDSLSQRVAEYKINPPGDNWDWTLTKELNE